MILQKYLLICCCVIGAAYVQAQDSIVHRVILIGDAGEMDKQQQAILVEAAGFVLPGRSTTFYLGDNIYPTGMALPGTKKEAETKAIIRSQFEPMRQHGAAVYFIPGNHDWDRMGVKGLEKIKLQSRYIEEQNDSMLHFVPANGCPGPVEINISDSFTIIAFDSEWWLFPFNKSNPDAACDCNSIATITARMQEIFYRNRYKMIMLASHHPFQSYGHHGGYYSWKDHLFPFTAINKNLYIPLPVIGSLYPVLRKTFPTEEDMGHPLYKNMIARVNEVFDGFPNLVYAAGHEHGLQLIEDKRLQVISGAGAKNAYVHKGKHALFGEKEYGFVTADVMSNNNINITYYTYSDSGFTKAYTYTKPYVNVRSQELAITAISMGDSIIVKAYPKFDSVSKVHRLFFGENYRKEYAAPTTVPVLYMSKVKGGLTPVRLGGGHQTKSLRLKDKSGKEWTLRSIQKYPDVLLPEAFRETFAKDLLVDNMSSQHPYSALVVPPIAHAVGVPHTNPIIGWVAPDASLGIYYKTFANTLCLLEEREPTGNSDNTPKMYEKLDEDNDNSVDSTAFLKARMLDVLIGDWDRHEDQWRWMPEKDGKGKKYVAVPRDRDQVFYVNQGVVPWFGARKWILRFLQGFDGSIRNINDYVWESRFMNARFLNQFSHEQWMKIANDFVAAATDSVFDAALKRLPASVYNLRHDYFYTTLKQRRDGLPKEMDQLYTFLNKIVDIQTSDKNEFVNITDAPNGDLTININKLSKNGKIRDNIFSKTFDHSLTKEIRIFVAKGDDSIAINTQHSPIKLRIVGGDGNKAYNATNVYRTVKVYEKESNARFTGNAAGELCKHLSNDTSNTAIVPTNLYDVVMPLVDVGFNVDDGFLFGLGVRYIRPGFRKLPYASKQQLTVSHSFSTAAYRAKYSGEWLQLVGKADLLAHAYVFAPNNTVNFFGRGNETAVVKNGDDWIRYYRTRFNMYFGSASLRWKAGKSATIATGLAFQYYHYDSAQNVGKFIGNTSLINSYDSNTISKDRVHAGITVEFTNDRRNSKILPTWGSYVNFKVVAYKGMNDAAASYMQIFPQVALYKSLNAKSSIVLAERLGGGISVGKTAFYQSAFLGAQENLWGYRQYRYAGQHMMYNNLELRIKLAEFANYIVPGQFGIMGFYDVGRVWVKGEDSNKWHNGTGGGIYFAPAQLTVVQFVVTTSKEGVYPYLTFGFRF